MRDAVRQSTGTRVWDHVWAGPVGRVFRRLPGLWLVPLVVFVAAIGDGTVNSGPVLCLFRRVSGVPCAGCGMTRGFVAITHGHWHVAADYNLFAPLLFVWLCAWWSVAVAALVRDREPPAHPAWLVKGAVVTLFGYWVVRGAWFVQQAGAWDDMVAVSPVMRMVDALL